MTVNKDIEKQKTDVRELQDRAFLMFDKAKDLVNENKKDEAIAVYIELIKILNILRWSNVSKKIQEAILELQQSATEDFEEQIHEESITEPEVLKQPEDFSGVHPSLKSHVLSVKEFELYKQQQETQQKEAFALLDSGAALAKQSQFEKAIEFYNQAIILLNSIGWQAYTPQLQDEVERLVQAQKEFTETLQKQIEKPEMETIEELRTRREILQHEIDSRRISVKEFDERKKTQYNYLVRALQLLNECEGSIINLKYPDIYTILQQAAQNLINVGWQEGISRLTDYISMIKENQFQHELMEQQEHLAYIEKIRISEEIRKYFKVKILEKEKEKALPFHANETLLSKPKSKSYEQQVFEVITEASQIPGTDEKSSKRKIELYTVAFHLVEKSEWSDEKTKVQSIIDILKTNLENRKQRIYQLEETKTHALNILHAITDRMQEYLKEFDIEKEVQKTNLLQFQEHQLSIRSLENSAFTLIDTAQDYAKKLEFKEAIHAYEEAIEKFSHLKWSEQIPYIEKEIDKIKYQQKQLLTEQQLRDELRQQEAHKKQVKLKAEEIQKERELQNLQDISEMISGVVKQKELEEKQQKQSQEEFKKNIEKPQVDKEIQEFKDLIRKASKKKSDL